MEIHLRATGHHLPLWDHTVLPATQHKWTHPAITSANQAGTRFTYPGGMEIWVDLGSLIAARRGIETTTAWSQVRRPNCCATKTPKQDWHVELCVGWSDTSREVWMGSQVLLWKSCRCSRQSWLCCLCTQRLFSLIFVCAELVKVLQIELHFGSNAIKTIEHWTRLLVQFLIGLQDD